MKLIATLSFILLLATTVNSQDNCNVFLWKGDSCRYKACKYLEEAPGYFQLTKEYHEIKDSAIAICPEYALTYKHKSTAYLKTGDFINWKILIDKAVELHPVENLDYRGWCRFQFFRDYEGAIKDIEELDRLVEHDIGFCQNGAYHLNIAKGLCYKMLGQKKKAMQIISTQIEKDTSLVGLYDYLHLGVLHMENNDLDSAFINFSKQLIVNEIAECHYYLALSYKRLNKLKEAIQHLNKAKELYLSKTYMFDNYTHQVDKIYLVDIENELKQLE